MCGIIGQLNKIEQITISEFNDLRDLLVHRGPDGFGTQIINNGKVGLGHRRLSIIDLTDDAKQPMSNEDGTIWITFNGEIYNFPELKKELVNHHFKSSSDTEVLIHGYEEWGIELLLQKLKGMFSFAIWDEKQETLCFARDRFGIKPFVYQHTDQKFIFASELKSIANQKDFKKEISQDAIADYFTYSYIPYPNTIWEGVYKLEPAHYGVFDYKSFSLNIKKYWELKLDSKLESGEDAVEKTHQLIDLATMEHLLSDVPVGLFLSGGYDSTTLLMKMKELGYSPDTFTISFPGHVNDESQQAALIAKYFGVKHFIEPIESDFDIVKILEELSKYYDEPFAGSSMINNHLIAKLTSQSMKVALSGEGADEVFGGYKWHRKIEAYYNENSLKRKARSFRQGLLSNESEFLELYNRSMLGVFAESQSLNIINPSIRKKMQQRNLWHFKSFYNYSKGLPDRVKQAQFIDANTFIPNHCLFRADLSSMANSLEVRVPFLDHEIYEYIFSLDRRVYMKKDIKKYLLEEKLKAKIPQEILSMPKKGFSFHYSGSNFNTEFEYILEKGNIIKHNIIQNRWIEKKSLSDNLKFHLVNLEYWLKNHFE
jgi:asparagine synthase (glutamine-hydrolysing)